MSLSPSTLIFDLDGTLLDSKRVILHSFQTAANLVFQGRSFDLNVVRVGPPLEQMFQTTFPDATAHELQTLVRAFRSEYDHTGPIATRAYQGTEKVLTDCQSRGIALHIATNKPSVISRKILENLKLDHFFQSIQSVDSVRPAFSGKVEILRHLLKSCQIVPRETWFVGDAREDAMAAAECQIPFIWAAYGYGRLASGQASSVFHTIHTLAELSRLLP